MKYPIDTNLHCPECVKLFLETGIEPFALGIMIQVDLTHYVCNMCDYEIEKSISQFHRD